MLNDFHSIAKKEKMASLLTGTMKSYIKNVGEMFQN